jgi:hypothetical protein
MLSWLLQVLFRNRHSIILTDFPFTSFDIHSLFCILNVLTIWLGEVLFWSCLIGVLKAFCTWMIRSYSKLGKVFAIVLLNIFSMLLAYTFSLLCPWFIVLIFYWCSRGLYVLFILFSFYYCLNVLIHLQIMIFSLLLGSFYWWGWQLSFFFFFKFGFLRFSFPKFQLIFLKVSMFMDFFHILHCLPYFIYLFICILIEFI